MPAPNMKRYVSLIQMMIFNEKCFLQATELRINSSDGTEMDTMAAISCQQAVMAAAAIKVK